MNNNLKIVFASMLCFLAICAYGKYRFANPDYHDPLMKPLGVFDLDGWSVAHFGFFATLGYLYPDTFFLAMGLGISWEVFEHLLGKNRPGVLGGFGDCMTTDPGVTGSWWFGRISDIIVNAIGFMIGVWAKDNSVI